MSPVLNTTPGSTEWAGNIIKSLKCSQTFANYAYIGPDLGAHTTEVLQDILGLSSQEIEELYENGITKLNNKEA